MRSAIRRHASSATILFAMSLGGSAAFGLDAAQPETVAALKRFSSNGCVPVTAAILDSAGIAGSRVKSLSYYPSGGSADIGRTANRLDAYVGLTDQPGSVVVVHSLDCSVVTVYARGGASLPRQPAIR